MTRSIPITTVVLIMLISACKDHPAASFSHSADSYEVGDTIYFQSTCQNAIDYDWDFGDENGSFEENPIHVYTAEGKYSVQLVVSNENGSDEVSEAIKISPSYPCWTELADLPTGRTTHLVAVVDNHIYVMGGANKNVEEYDPSSDNWTRKADMPTSRDFISGCAIDGKIYAVGGYSSDFVSTETYSILEEYDPATDTWTVKSPMPSPRWGHASIAVGGKIFVLGGAVGWPVTEFYNSIEIYDPGTDTWTTKTNPSGAGIIPRWGLSACLVNGRIYTMGGTRAARYPNRDQSFSAMAVAEVYDPETNTWEQKTSMPTARWSPAAVGVNNKIYVIGGGDKYYADVAYQIVEEYDPSTDTWDTRTPMPAGRLGLAGCEMDNIIYLPGGGGPEYGDKYKEFFTYDPACDTINNWK